MKLSLVPHDHVALKTRCERFDFAKPQHDPQELARELARVMLEHGGIGLSAPQVGLSLRVIALASNPVGVLFNPIIVDQSTTTTELEEGCLSFPGMVLKVTRPRIVKVRFSLADGVVKTKQFSDFTARVICHEIDHLDGLTFFDKQEGLKKEFARKKWAKMVKRGLPETKGRSFLDNMELSDFVLEKAKNVLGRDEP